MPIASYLVHPAPGMKTHVTAALNRIHGCEVVPSENRDVLVLITDTPDRKSDRKLSRVLDTVEGIHCLSLVYGHMEQGFENTKVGGENAQ